MKTYGQIYAEGKTTYLGKRGVEIFTSSKLEWQDFSDAEKKATEAGAQAVIDEFKRRHCIHIGTPEDMGERFIDAWHRAEHGEEVNETHITVPEEK